MHGSGVEFYASLRGRYIRVRSVSYIHRAGSVSYVIMKQEKAKAWSEICFVIVRFPLFNELCVLRSRLTLMLR